MNNPKLFEFRSFNGARSGASTAFYALVGIDDIFAVFFGNGANRASVCARSAAEAFVRIDYIRHNSFPTFAIELCMIAKSSLQL